MSAVDVFAHCLGYIAVIENGVVQGYNVTVGGGMGMTHNNKKTYPQVAKLLGFCTPQQVSIHSELSSAVGTPFTSSCAGIAAVKSHHSIPVVRHYSN